MATYTYDDCGSGWRRDFPEYGMSTQVGDIACQRVVQHLRTEIRLGHLDRQGLDKKILLGILYVATAGHPEVSEVATLVRLEAQINAIPECRQRGWMVSWQDWRS